MHTSPSCSLLIWNKVITLIFLKHHFDFLKSIFKVNSYHIMYFLHWWSFCVIRERFTSFFSMVSWYFMESMFCTRFNYSSSSGIEMAHNFWYFKWPTYLYLHHLRHLWIFLYFKLLCIVYSILLFKTVTSQGSPLFAMPISTYRHLFRLLLHFGMPAFFHSPVSNLTVEWKTSDKPGHPNLDY